MATRRRPSRISKKRAQVALVSLLYGATAERLRGFTAASLAASYNVTLATAERRLSDARKGRGL